MSPGNSADGNALGHSFAVLRNSYACLGPVSSDVSAVFCPGCIDPKEVLANTTAPMAHEGGRRGSWPSAARAAERAAQAPDNPATAAPAGVVTDAAPKACPAQASSSSQGSTAPPTTAPSGVPPSVPASSSASSATPVSPMAPSICCLLGTRWWVRSPRPTVGKEKREWECRCQAARMLPRRQDQRQRQRRSRQPSSPILPRRRRRHRRGPPRCHLWLPLKPSVIAGRSGGP